MFSFVFVRLFVVLAIIGVTIAQLGLNSNLGVGLGSESIHLKNQSICYNWCILYGGYGGGYGGQQGVYGNTGVGVQPGLVGGLLGKK